MRRRYPVLSAVLAMGVAGAALVTGVGHATAGTTAPTAAPTTTLAWGAAEAVPGLAALNRGGDARVVSVSCAAAGNCGAGGFYETATAPQVAFVVSEVNGRWGAAEAVPGLAALGAEAAKVSEVLTVSCASAGNCSAGGTARTSATSGPQGFVVGEVNGRWGKAEAVPGLAGLNTGGDAQVESVSCTAAGRCVAGGFYTARGAGDGNRAFVADETGGVWGPAREIADAPGGAITSVACASAGHCAAVGYDVPSSATNVTQAITVDETAGVWGAAKPVAGLAAQLNSVSCASAGNCSAGGISFDPVGKVDQAFVVNETAGHWGTAQPVPGLAARTDGSNSAVNSVSCVSAGDCVAGGDYGSPASSSRAFVVDETKGTWSAVTPLPSTGSISSVSCASAGNCSAVGHSGVSGGTPGTLLVDQAHGVWGGVQKVAGVTTDRGQAMVTAVSCRPSGQCSAGGLFTTGSGVQAFVVSRTLVAVTRAAVSLSAARVSYGDEEAERVSVAVASSHGGTPSGPVAVRTRSGALCTISLKAGKGSCAVPAQKSAPGPVTVTASYGGAPGFAASVSAARTFTVVKAATRTRLTLSAAKITHGHEGSERLTVTVAPRYVGTASGTVAVTAGTTSACVIKLSKGRGSCLLPASRLNPGTYHLIAHWPGNADFTPSTSTPAPLTVLR
jgi:Bacterial Ig-like domain (group 3)